jgi:hypothetical protein
MVLIKDATDVFYISINHSSSTCDSKEASIRTSVSKQKEISYFIWNHKNKAPFCSHVFEDANEIALWISSLSKAKDSVLCPKCYLNVDPSTSTTTVPISANVTVGGKRRTKDDTDSSSSESESDTDSDNDNDKGKEKKTAKKKKKLRPIPNLSIVKDWRKDSDWLNMISFLHMEDPPKEYLTLATVEGFYSKYMFYSDLVSGEGIPPTLGVTDSIKAVIVPFMLSEPSDLRVHNFRALKNVINNGIRRYHSIKIRNDSLVDVQEKLLVSLRMWLLEAKSAMKAWESTNERKAWELERNVALKRQTQRDIHQRSRGGYKYVPSFLTKEKSSYEEIWGVFGDMHILLICLIYLDYCIQYDTPFYTVDRKVQLLRDSTIKRKWDELAHSIFNANDMREADMFMKIEYNTKWDVLNWYSQTECYSISNKKLRDANKKRLIPYE